MRYKMCSTASFCAVLFAVFHLSHLEGEDDELRNTYFNKACDGGIVFG